MELQGNKKDMLIAVGAVVAAAFFVIAIKHQSSSSSAATQAAATSTIQPVYNTAAETVTVPKDTYNITYNTHTVTTTNTVNGAPTAAASTVTTPAQPSAPQVTTQAPTATPVNPAPAPTPVIPKTTGQLAINTYYAPSQLNNSGVTSNQSLWGQSNPNYNPSQPQSASNPAAYSSTGIAETIAGSNSSDPGAVGYYSTHDPGASMTVQGAPNTSSYKAYTTWNGKAGYWDENGDFHSNDGTIGG